ncbi:SurA N-terminal domain-containing protein [Nocardioides rotundus]|uniref:SurA N-terminal domain-containing protein n=1 Tax=Nocardioides rotundus TaxID=1774216 RepID=UPI001CBB7314|nr:SurA N-terminal domain-containing protein [Nocardioides rotundus]UAL30598.1 SurA N-terminal domain-containing protein [Nocardioides rotundus]
MRTRKVWLAVPACLFLLTGCGSGSPNVAATVGETTIKMSEVDQLAQDYCTATKQAYQQNGVVLPMGTVRRQVVSSLVLREIANQMAEQYDVAPGKGYAQAVQQSRQQSRSMPDAAREAATTIDTTGGYLQDIAVAAAEQALADEGVTGLSQQQVTERAIEMFTSWSDRSPIEVNPKLGVEWSEGTLAPTEGGGLSVPVSEDAKSAQVVQRFENAQSQDEQVELAQQLTGYARTLPPSQRCG